MEGADPEADHEDILRHEAFNCGRAKIIISSYVQRKSTDAILIANTIIRFLFRKQYGSMLPASSRRSRAWIAKSESRRQQTEKLSHDRTNHGEVHLGCSTVVDLPRASVPATRTKLEHL